jgi:hypothetical protein
VTTESTPRPDRRLITVRMGRKIGPLVRPCGGRVGTSALDDRTFFVRSYYAEVARRIVLDILGHSPEDLVQTGRLVNLPPSVLSTR